VGIIGLLVAFVYPLLSSVSIMNIIAFIIRNKDKQRYFAHTSKVSTGPSIHFEVQCCQNGTHWLTSSLVASAQMTGITKQQDIQIMMLMLKICASLIPDVLKIQTAFRNLDGASGENKTDGLTILLSVVFVS
jgi:hypothetical protein